MSRSRSDDANLDAQSGYWVRPTRPEPVELPDLGHNPEALLREIADAAAKEMSSDSLSAMIADQMAFVSDGLGPHSTSEVFDLPTHGNPVGILVDDPPTERSDPDTANLDPPTERPDPDTANLDPPTERPDPDTANLDPPTGDPDTASLADALARLPDLGDPELTADAETEETEIYAGDRRDLDDVLAKIAPPRLDSAPAADPAAPSADPPRLPVAGASRGSDELELPGPPQTWHPPASGAADASAEVQVAPSIVDADDSDDAHRARPAPRPPRPVEPIRGAFPRRPEGPPIATPRQDTRLPDGSLTQYAGLLPSDLLEEAAVRVDPWVVWEQSADDLQLEVSASVDLILDPPTADAPAPFPEPVSVPLPLPLDPVRPPPPASRGVPTWVALVLQTSAFGVGFTVAFVFGVIVFVLGLVALLFFLLF